MAVLLCVCKPGSSSHWSKSMKFLTSFGLSLEYDTSGFALYISWQLPILSSLFNNQFSIVSMNVCALIMGFSSTNRMCYSYMFTCQVLRPVNLQSVPLLSVVLSSLPWFCHLFTQTGCGTLRLLNVSRMDEPEADKINWLLVLATILY